MRCGIMRSKEIAVVPPHVVSPNGGLDMAANKPMHDPHPLVTQGDTYRQPSLFSIMSMTGIEKKYSFAEQ